MTKELIFLILAALLPPSFPFSLVHPIPPFSTCLNSVAPQSPPEETAELELDRPTLEQTLAAASYVQTQLDSSNLAEINESLLRNLNAIASSLLEEHEAFEEAAQLFHYSLILEDNVAVQERLAACYRFLNQHRECAQELYGILQTLGKDGDPETLSWLYLDLGHSLEEAQPLPGSGSKWDEIITEESNVKGVALEVEDGGQIKEIELTPFECYRKSIQLDPSNGMAHKRLADALAILGQKEEALAEFTLASNLLAEDICCATHVHYDQQSKPRNLDALPMAPAKISKVTLEDLCWDPAALKNEEETPSMAASFERDGVLVFPGLLSAAECNALARTVSDVANEAHEATDFTMETRAPSQRTHMALPLENASEGLSKVLDKLYPLLSNILQCQKSDSDHDHEDESIPLIGAGFMKTGPGAQQQTLHKDVHHYDRHSNVSGMPSKASPDMGGPRCLSIQIQLTDTTTADKKEGGPSMGSLEVLPGSHRPDASNGSPILIDKAVQDGQGVIAINVPPGSVTIYSSRLWHRGGSNDSEEERTFCFLTVTEPDSAAPPGLIHTMIKKDIGNWVVTRNGLEARNN